ncbi:MAG: AAA family ATPase, partial [Candidatus Methanomethylophilaceae archaeon]|nr:AAA family ATPase [Candidatus Methanomethylophilaceae archaeon]
SIINQTLDVINMRMFVKRLCRMYHEAFGMKTVILVDEYDHWAQGIGSRPLMDAIMKELTPFMEQCFKFNDDIRFGVVTGIMPLAKTGMLSSFNNASVCSILETVGDEFFGFMEQEVLRLLQDTGNEPEKITEIREWYDGYRFGDAEVYNPYSVILYLKNGCRPEGYWNGQTGGGLSSELVSSLGPGPLMSLMGMYERGEVVESPINVRVDYADVLSPKAEPSTVYSYLAMAGCLKTVRTGGQEDGIPVCKVGMVNKEVSKAFASLVRRAKEAKVRVRVDLPSHLYAGDQDGLRDDFQFILADAAMDLTWDEGSSDPKVSKHAHELYKNTINGAIRASGLVSSTEVPKGFGICDIFIPPADGKPAVVIEIKTSKAAWPSDLADDAFLQILDKGYVSQPLDGGAIWIAVGIRVKEVCVRTSNGYSF